MDEFVYDLEEKLKAMAAIRKKAGYTQAELADLLGVDRTRVVRWEQGSDFPRFETLVQLVRFLDLAQMQTFGPPDFQEIARQIIVKEKEKCQKE